MKLFAAIVPPQSAVQELAAAVRPLHSLPQAAALRWTGLPTWHLTLAFLGQVEEATLPELRAQLGQAAADRPGFELQLSGGGHFGDRALWAGVRAGAGATALSRLAGEVADAARRVGIDVEDRPFQGHLTLARSSTPRGTVGRGSGPDLRPLVAGMADFKGESWPADTLHLLRSHPGAGSTTYETVAAWPLGR